MRLDQAERDVVEPRRSEAIGSHHVVTLFVDKTPVRIEFEAALFTSENDIVEVAGYRAGGVLHALAFANLTNNTGAYQRVWTCKVGFFVAAVLTAGCVAGATKLLIDGHASFALMVGVPCLGFATIMYATRTDWLSRTRARALMRGRPAGTSRAPV